MAKQQQRRKQRMERPVEQARAELRELLNAAEFRGERVVITRYRRPVAALVSIADLEKLERVA